MYTSTCTTYDEDWTTDRRHKQSEARATTSLLNSWEVATFFSYPSPFSPQQQQQCDHHLTSDSFPSGNHSVTTQWAFPLRTLAHLLPSLPLLSPPHHTTAHTTPDCRGWTGKYVRTYVCTYKCMHTVPHTTNVCVHLTYFYLILQISFIKVSRY